MALQQMRATPAAEIKGDQAELNQQNSLTSTNLNHTTELSNATLTALKKYFSANLWKYATADKWGSSPSSVQDEQFSSFTPARPTAPHTWRAM